MAKKEMDQLTKDCIEARKAGMTYGKWKAMQPRKEKAPEQVVEEEKPSGKYCRVCGKMIPKTSPRKVYCSNACMDRYFYYQAKKKKAGKEDDDGKI